MTFFLAAVAAAASNSPVVLNVSMIAGAITAIGALGTAAFGLVDATKLIYGGVSSSGFVFIRRLIEDFAPTEKGIPSSSAISRPAILATLKANWLNGAPLADLKATAKSLIKLRLNAETAEELAKATGVDPAILGQVAVALNHGTALTPEQMNVYGRFDLLLATSVDRAYQKADQRYRNTAKMAAAVVAVLLAEIAAWALFDSAPGFQGVGSTFVYGFLAGVLATPLAPIAKDLATSINTAAKAVQSLKGQS